MKRLVLVPLGKSRGHLYEFDYENLCSEVVKAKHSSSNKTVALKKIFIRAEQEGFPITSLREIKLLKNVHHPNVVNLVDMCASYKPSSNSNEPEEIAEILMVFPYMDHDLVGLLENQKVHLTQPVIKCYFRQVLSGLEYLHQVCSACNLFRKI